MAKKKVNIGAVVEHVFDAINSPEVKEVLNTVTETRDGINALEILCKPEAERFVAWFDDGFVRRDRFVSETDVQLLYQYWCREVNRVLPEHKFREYLTAACDVYIAFGWAVVVDGEKYRFVKRDTPEFPLSWYLGTYKVLRKRLKFKRLKAFFDNLFSDED